MTEPIKYIVTDLVDRNTVIVDKYDVADKLTELFNVDDLLDEDAENIKCAIENIEDYMWRRLNEPMWGNDALQLRIEEYEETI